MWPKGIRYVYGVPDVGDFEAAKWVPILIDSTTGYAYCIRGDGQVVPVASGGAAAWGAITGTLSNQADLQAVLDSKGTSDFSGVYNDLTGKPTLFSGAYADLTGKPTLGTAAATAATDYATAAQGGLAATALQPSGNGGSLTGLTKNQVGLANADNTSDANKPVSTATQTALDGKQISGAYATGTGSANGTNTGDNATNTQYSGLAASKQDTLVSGTNIKTINGASVLGSGNLSVSAADPVYAPGSFTVANGSGRLFIKRLQLASAERATVAGNARLRIA